MIQPQELRIGNLLYKFGIDYNNDFPSIDRNDREIITVDLEVLENIENFNGTTDFMYFEPIPLTEEILLKFGFEKEGGYLSIGKLRGAITVCKAERESDSLCYRWFVNNLKMTDLHFVHQLQNLFFALTGEELKFK